VREIVGRGEAAAGDALYDAALFESGYGVSPAADARFLATIATRDGHDVGALLRVSDPAVIRAVFAQRDRVNPGLRPYLYIALERHFRAHLGADDAAWTVWLDAHPP
jgi:hypothetical protein